MTASAVSTTAVTAHSRLASAQHADSALLTQSPPDHPEPVTNTCQLRGSKPNIAEQTRTNLNIPEHLNAPIPCNTQQITHPTAHNKIISLNAEQLPRAATHSRLASAQHADSALLSQSVPDRPEPIPNTCQLRGSKPNIAEQNRTKPNKPEHF